MTLTARDRKLLAILLALAVVAAYWFLVLGPKRDEAQLAADELTEQEERRDAALASVARLESARGSFATDYASVVRLGKAIPADVDVPSLMVQLEDAADGAGIEFDSITVGERTPLAAAPGATPDPAAPAPDSQPAAAPGGAPAQTAPGTAAETAGETAAASATGSGAASTGAPGPAGSEPAGSGTPPVASPTGETPAAPSPSLEGVALNFSFEGDFFDLADLFHELKRFVDVQNRRVEVGGRLLTIDSVSLVPSEKGSDLAAEVGATAYLAPAAQGPTAGATPAGPAGAAPPTSQPAGDSAPDGAAPPAAAGTAPTAGVTP